MRGWRQNSVHRAASVREWPYSSGVIGISIRIHDPPNQGPSGQAPDRGDHLLARCRDARIHDENAIIARDGDIGARANEHVNVPCTWKGLDVALILLGSRGVAPQRRTHMHS